MDHVAAAAWDQHAVTYARLFEPLTGFIARAMLRMIEPWLPPRAAVLDIACGTGALAVPAVERALRERAATGSAGLVVATDFSAGMVAHTQRAAAALGAGDLIRCEVQDGEALTYSDGTFDAAFSSFGIFLFNDRRAGWREAARVLRPGGRFVTSVWQGPQRNQLLREQMLPMVQALPPRLFPQTAQHGWIQIAEADALVAEVTDSAPFTDVRCRPFHATIALGDWSGVWDAMRDNPVVGALLRQCSPTELEAVRASVTGRFRELAGGDDQPLLLESVCNILTATRR